MAKSPNTDPFNGYSTNWTQPYVSMNPVYIPRINNLDRHAQVMNELYDLECTDQQVDEMLTYPDAERIINRVMKQIKGNKDV